MILSLAPVAHNGRGFFTNSGFAVAEDQETVTCLKCGKPMRRIVFLPPEGDLPAVESYQCTSCGGEFTREIE
jgi:hypothetical protein